MTKLEEEMLKAATEAVFEANKVGKEWKSVIAERTSEIAKKYIEKAYNVGFSHGYNWVDHGYNPKRNLTEWLKENGIAE